MPCHAVPCCAVLFLWLALPLPCRDLQQLLQQWAIAADDSSSSSSGSEGSSGTTNASVQRSALLAKLWLPCPSADADAHAAASAAACQQALSAVPAAELAYVSLRCNAALIAAASNAVADAAD